MIPRGAAPLIAMRLEGDRPECSVWVNVGDFTEPDWWRWANSFHAPELVVRPEDPIDRLDLRCLVGLEVILFFGDYDVRAHRIYERLQEYVEEIAVLSPSFAADIGWWWLKGRGRIEFDDRQHLEALKSAQGDATHAALKRDKAAYDAAKARELKTLEAAPWLR